MIAYLIATTNMTPRKALTSVQSKWAIVCPNRSFMSQLQEYYSKCSNSLLQAEVGDEPPNKDGELPGNAKGLKGRRGYATKAAAKRLCLDRAMGGKA